MAQASRRRRPGRQDAGAKVGRPSAKQAELARLRRRVAEAERKLATTQTAFEIVARDNGHLGRLSDRGDEGIVERRMLGHSIGAKIRAMG